MKYRMSPLKAFPVLVMVILFASCKKNDHQVPPSASKNYQRIIDAFVNAGATGVSVTVISPEGTWNKCGGKADIARNIDLTPSNTLRIGSISKTFAAATILKLQEEGVLNIKDKINKYIPRTITDNITNANDASIEQCLNMTTGIIEFYSEEILTGMVNGQYAKLSPEEKLKLIYEKPANFPVGTNMSYSNTNYILLSLVIKYATGRPAYDVVREKIINPLHLQNTFASTTLPGTLSKSYYETDPGVPMVDASEIDNIGVGGQDNLEGGMISNSADVAKFMEALLTGKVVSQASLNQMETFGNIPQSELEPDLFYYTGYGLGLMKLDTDHGTAIGHDGHVYGFVGKAYYLPAQKITMVILLNGYSESSVAVLNAKETFNLLF